MKYMRADKSTIPTLSLDGNEAITDKHKSSMFKYFLIVLTSHCYP